MLSAFTVLQNIIAGLFSRVDPVFLSIYSLANGIGGAGNNNLTSMMLLSLFNRLSINGAVTFLNRSTALSLRSFSIGEA